MTAVKSRALDPIEALETIFDRLDSAFNKLHPGDLTDDERHGIAQDIWFSMSDCKRALGDLYWPGPTA